MKNEIRWSLCHWGFSSGLGGFACEAFVIVGHSVWLLIGLVSIGGYLCPYLLSRRPLFIDLGNLVSRFVVSFTLLASFTYAD